MKRKKMEEIFRGYYFMTKREEENLKNMTDEELEKEIKMIKDYEFDETFGFNSVVNVKSFIQNEMRF